MKNRPAVIGSIAVSFHDGDFNATGQIFQEFDDQETKYFWSVNINMGEQNTGQDFIPAPSAKIANIEALREIMCEYDNFHKE